MARDPANDGAFVFDLVDADAVAEASDTSRRPDEAPAGEDAGTDVPRVPGGPNRWLRTSAPVAAVLAIALGTGYALDGVREAERIDRITGVTGGVVDVSAPLEELWEWDGDVGSSGGGEDRGGPQVSMVGDLLVFVSAGELLALDSASGAQAWTVPLGDAPDCGPGGYPGWEDIATEIVVCLQGAETEREAITVGVDGVLSEPRALDAEDDQRYGTARPGPDGTVLRAERVGPLSAVDLGDADCTTGDTCTGTVEAGRDIVLRAEDAVTGAVRWTVTAPFVATSAASCNPWRGAAWGGDPDLTEDHGLLNPDAFGARITSRLVHLFGCGVNASVTSDGMVLQGVGDSVTSRIDRLSTGGYVASGSGPTTQAVVYSADGEALEEVAGNVYEARVVDGSGMLLAWRESADRLRAYDADGTLRWEGAPRWANAQFAAEVGETAVVVVERGLASGLDVATGDARWVQDLSEGAGARSGDLYLYQAFTDGRHALLLLRNEAGSFELVSLDIASGEVAWHEPMADIASLPQSATTLVSVAGNLLAVTPLGVRGLG